MKTIIKKPKITGNSAAVGVPKNWMNSYVKVELMENDPSIILKDTLEILENNKISLSKIIGIYLVGSYARYDENIDSDIDIFVLTLDMNNRITEGKYDLLLYSIKDIKNDIKIRALPTIPMLKEAIPLINGNAIKDLKKMKITKKNTKWYIDTTKEKIKLLEESIAESNNKIHDKIIYTLVLRIRTLYIIKKLKQNKIPNKKDLIKIIEKLTNNTSYERYLVVKNNQKEKSIISKKDAEKLLDYLKKQLKLV